MSAITLSCEVCGAPTGDDPHFPHDPECSGVLDLGCYCAALTCARCCWDDECKSSDLLLLDGSDSGSGGRDTAAAATSVDGALPLGAGSTAGGAEMQHTTPHTRPPSTTSVE